MVVKLTDLIAGMLAAQELRERAAMAEEYGLTPEEMEAISAALGEPEPHEEPQD